MARPKFVQIKKDDVIGQCLPESLKAWEANGWTAVDDGSSEPEPSGETETAPVVNDPPADEKKKEGGSWLA